ncbi:unnamed protein product [Brachionus calyciflorus]|uniref:PEST proteolytic signal-containing nuclear protein n=1 Tax=Brachionus calyciflorus TaxID=104777 RepID=A0A813MFX4_9BILA|nr:unnamed protein product [Brachionus calyciflorus]
MSKESKSIDENTNSLKRKNDDSLPASSDSQSNDKSNEQNKKLKIPIKLAAQPKIATAKYIEKESKTPNSNGTKKELPSGNLASSNKQPISVVKNVSSKVAEAFCSDDDDETEEIPFEAKIRMRNIGRNTPTSTGPNSYGKFGSLGFVDSRKLFEKQLKEKADELLKLEEENSSKK